MVYIWKVPFLEAVLTYPLTLIPFWFPMPSFPSLGAIRSLALVCFRQCPTEASRLEQLQHYVRPNQTGLAAELLGTLWEQTLYSPSWTFKHTELVNSAQIWRGGSVINTHCLALCEVTWPSQTCKARKEHKDLVPCFWTPGRISYIHVTPERCLPDLIFKFSCFWNSTIFPGSQIYFTWRCFF